MASVRFNVFEITLASTALFAAVISGCANADQTEDPAPAKTVYTWPAKDAGSTTTKHDAGAELDAAVAGYEAFESDAGTSTGTGAGTGTGTGTGSGLDACGICDRAWQCDADDDMWTSSGSTACVNSRTGTQLNCDGTMQSGGTWSGDSSELILAFPSFSSTVDVTCTPGE
jgi:hypothetical protein